MQPQSTPMAGAKPSPLYLQNQTARIARSIDLLREIRAAVARDRDGLGPDLEIAVAHVVELYCADSLGSDFGQAVQS
jgi:hypothetical protein